jgi:1-acyl-sn-glycerol-3-phosphate acyltransferase
MEPWHFDAAKDLDQSMIERLRHFPREPDMLVYGLRSAATVAFRSWLRLYHRLTVSGRENLPTEGSFVVVANHASHLDALCLLAALPFGKLHRAFPAAAHDYFFVNVPRLLLSTIAINALPFDRRDNPRHSLSLCRQVLDNAGTVLIIFPEGSRSPTGEIAEFKPGVGLLVAGTNTPVLPCYLEGAHRAWPKGGWFPRPLKIQVRIGPPRHYPELSRTKNDAMAIVRDLRDAVLALK